MKRAALAQLAPNAVPCRDAAAMVSYLPYSGTRYDVTQFGSVELCFGTLVEARAFFDKAARSGEVERAELRKDEKGFPRGRLIDEFDESTNPYRKFSNPMGAR